MSETKINQQAMLKKLGIEKLNPMQEETHKAILSEKDVVLLSPTGTGKTLAFLLPIIEKLDPECTEVQVLILVPSRELALQIEQVTRSLGSGFKANAVYGGRAGHKDRMDIKHRPAILIGTPGRVADHLRRENFSSQYLHTIVLDEFDKSLEIGFELDMNEIIDALPIKLQRILTSATEKAEIPAFVRMSDPMQINFLEEGIPQLEVKIVVARDTDKLETLVKMLHKKGDQPGIVFCNFKDTIQGVSDTLTENDIPHGCFYGGMEQKDRERALLKFRNGTYHLIVATDLAARGIDVPEIRFIIHYQLPHSAKEFTHRNGRTARMNRGGIAYVLKGKDEPLREFISLSGNQIDISDIEQADKTKSSTWKTLYVSGGRRDKISKGDVAGFFMKQGKLNKDQLGIIEIKQDCAYVAVQASQIREVVQLTNNARLKKKKIRVSLV